MKKRLTISFLILALITVAYLFPLAVVNAADTGADKHYALIQKIKEAWDNGDKKLYFDEGEVTYDELVKAYYEAMDSEYFYISGTMGVNKYDETYIKYAYIYYDYENEEELSTKKNAFNQALSEFDRGVDPSWTDLEVLVYINDYLSENVTYDHSLKADNIFDVYGAMVNHLAVCEGYSKAFKLLAERNGIECYVVSCDELEHAWNMVKLNGNYYMVDVTWDDYQDNILNNGRFRFFLRSYNWFNSSESGHAAEGYEVKGYGLDASMANDAHYDGYFWDTPFVLKNVNGSWYGTDRNNNIDEYACDGVDFIVDKQIADLSDTYWMIDGTETGYRAHQSVRFATYNNYLFYSLPDRVMRYNTITGETKTIYILSSEELALGKIYGLEITGGDKLRIYLAKSLSSSDIAAGTIIEYNLSEVMPDVDPPIVTISIDSEGWSGIYDGEDEHLTSSSDASINIIDDSDISELGYFLSKVPLTTEYLDSMQASSWTAINSGSNRFEYTSLTSCDCYLYVKAVDKYRNAGYASTCKLKLDKESPVIGAQNNDIFYEYKEISITDDNLDKVYLNGEEISLKNGKIVLFTSDDDYVIKAVDKLGNESTVTVSVKALTYVATFNWSDDYSYASVELVSSPIDTYSSSFSNVSSECVVTAPTCTVAGKKTYTVTVEFNGTEYSDSKEVPIAALNHDWDDGEVTTKPGCTKNGVKTYRCKRTGCQETRTEVVEASGHTPGNTVIENEVESTCTVKGSYDEVIYCTECNEEISRTAKEKELKSHTIVDIPAVEATCKNPGSTAGKKCSVCETVIVKPEEIDALPHTPGNTVIENEVESTCTVKGSYDEVIYCTECNEEISRTAKEKELKSHTIVDIPAVEATCKNPGSTAGKKCSVCETVIVKPEEIDALPHTPGNTVIENEVESTCTVKGSYDEVIYCTECNEEISRTAKEKELKSHTIVDIPAVEATCKNPGSTAGKKCSVCETVIVKPEEIDALPHTPGNTVIENEVESTCTVKGSYDEVIYCTECNEEISRTAKEKELKSHTIVDIPAVEATCKNPGSTAGKKCSVCETVIVKPEEIDALGHDWDGGEVTKDPGCTEAGVKTYKCRREGCTTTKTESIPAKGHIEVRDVAVAATTQSTGLTEGVHCSECGMVIKAQTVIPKLEDQKQNDQKQDNQKQDNHKQDNSGKDNNKKNDDTSKPTDANKSSTNINAPEIKGTVHGDLSSGLWVEKADGTYPVNQWATLNGNIYYFDAKGYAAANEYANGVWFDSFGKADETYSMVWKSNSTGYWIEDKSGWYPVSKWLKIDGVWYYFDENGYMASGEWRDGCWLSSNGAYEYEGTIVWKNNSSGWWIEDTSGWYAANCWQKIDGLWYYFGASGYMTTNSYVDGYWLGSDGVCQ